MFTSGSTEWESRELEEHILISVRERERQRERERERKKERERGSEREREVGWGSQPKREEKKNKR